MFSTFGPIVRTVSSIAEAFKVIVQLIALCLCTSKNLFPSAPEIYYQISRLALQGDCLFSAGHDGQIHQYVVSYSSPSSYRLAEPHYHRSPVVTDTSSRLVDLTIVTTYATAPVTAVSELWVGNECGRRVEGAGEARPRGEEGGEKVRLAVAGRSGSSRMSVWDITEARQIMDVRYLCCRNWGGCQCHILGPQPTSVVVCRFSAICPPRCRWQLDKGHIGLEAIFECAIVRAVCGCSQHEYFVELLTLFFMQKMCAVLALRNKPRGKVLLPAIFNLVKRHIIIAVCTLLIHTHVKICNTAWEK